MGCARSTSKLTFHLPPIGTLVANGPDDPLKYYYKPIIGSLYCARIKQALSLLRPPYKSIIELGYGSGILLPTLCNIGDRVYGVDLTSDPIIVRKNLKKIGLDASLFQCDIRDINLPNNYFDLVVAISIFEHINDLSPVVKKIYNLLSPGGEFLVGMPRVDPLMSKAFSLLGFKKIEAHHVTDYQHFLEIARKHFKVTKLIKIPNWGPEFIGIYFNMLLHKK